MERILVAEDEPAIALLLQMMLENHGYKVDIVADGKKALEVLSEDHVLLITDNSMPNLTGELLIRRLRHKGFTRPIISMSGTPILAPTWLEYGATDFMSKPFDRSTLIEKVESALNRPTS
jgi:DNA-binding response OmpR family regulator